MELTWRRTGGTVAAPHYIAGTVVDGKVAVVSGQELEDALAQAWRFFVTTIVPLAGPGEGGFIRCYINYSAGSVNLWVATKGDDDDGKSGRVGLIAGNLMAAWTDAATRDNNAGEIFRATIHQAQVRDFKTMLGLIARCDPGLNAPIPGREIRCTAVGCEKCIVGKVGGSDVYVTSSAEMAAEHPEDRDGPVDKKVRWGLGNDLPGNIQYSGKGDGLLNDEEFIGVAMETWTNFLTHIVPLNEPGSWDHVRFEFDLGSIGRVSVCVADRGKLERVDRGGLWLELGNFRAALREVQKTEDYKAYAALQVRWAKLFIEGANRLVAKNKEHPLRGVRVEFWEHDTDEALHEATIKRGRWWWR